MKILRILGVALLLSVVAFAVIAIVSVGVGRWWPWQTVDQTQTFPRYGYLYDLASGSGPPYYELELTFRSEGPFCVGREIDIEATFVLSSIDVLDDRNLELELPGARLKGNTTGPARIQIEVLQHATDLSPANATVSHATVVYHQPSVEAGNQATLTLCVKGKGIGHGGDGNDTGGWVCQDGFLQGGDTDFLYVAPLQTKLQEEMNRTLLVIGILATVLAAWGITLQALRWLQQRGQA